MKRFPFFLDVDAGAGSGGAADAAATTQQAAAPATGSWSWAKEDGSFSDGWLNKLAPELQGDPSLRALGSVPDLAKSYVETKRLMGKKLEMPGEGAAPEQVAAWRKTVGAPETAEGYIPEGAKSLRPEAVPEGLWDTASEKQFLALAHKHSLPPAAVKEILDFYGGNVAAGLNASKKAGDNVLKEEGAKLRTAWGKDYDANLQLASRVAETVGLPKDHAAFTDASVLQAFAKFGRLLSEDRLVKGSNASVSGAVEDRVRDITDPKSMSTMAREYRGDFGPERQAAAQTQLHELYAAAAQK